MSSFLAASAGTVGVQQVAAAWWPDRDSSLGTHAQCSPMDAADCLDAYSSHSLFSFDTPPPTTASSINLQLPSTASSHTTDSHDRRQRHLQGDKTRRGRLRTALWQLGQLVSGTVQPVRQEQTVVAEAAVAHVQSLHLQIAQLQRQLRNAQQQHQQQQQQQQQQRAQQQQQSHLSCAESGCVPTALGRPSPAASLELHMSYDSMGIGVGRLSMDIRIMAVNDTFKQMNDVVDESMLLGLHPHDTALRPLAMQWRLLSQEAYRHFRLACDHQRIYEHHCRKRHSATEDDPDATTEHQLTHLPASTVIQPSPSSDAGLMYDAIHFRDCRVVTQQELRPLIQAQAGKPLRLLRLMLMPDGQAYQSVVYQQYEHGVRADGLDAVINVITPRDEQRTVRIDEHMSSALIRSSILRGSSPPSITVY